MTLLCYPLLLILACCGVIEEIGICVVAGITACLTALMDGVECFIHTTIIVGALFALGSFLYRICEIDGEKVELKEKIEELERENKELRRPNARCSDDYSDYPSYMD